MESKRVIRRSTEADIPAMMEIYRQARFFMRESGNPDQWDDSYPSVEILKGDILRNESFVCLEDDTIVGTFMLSVGEDPTYGYIESGKWLNDEPYGVIHRIASLSDTKGVGSFCITWCENQIKNIRIDTHEKNVPMRKFLLKHGYVQCGTIYLENGDSRIAYQKTSNPELFI